MICPNCQLDNSEEAYFCKNCGLNLHLPNAINLITNRYLKTNSEKKIYPKAFLKLIALPLALACLNVFASFYYTFLPDPAGAIIFILLRVIFILWAGALITYRGLGSLRQAGIAGAVLFFVDHVILKGGYFLLKGSFMAFTGVILTYVISLLVILPLGAVGGLLGKRNYDKKQTNA